MPANKPGNLGGKLVHETILSGNTPIGISRLARGLYEVQVLANDRGKIQSQMLVLE